MKYLKYVPPEIVAQEAREALANSRETPKEHIERLVRTGLIRILDDGEVEVCFERQAKDQPAESNGTNPKS